MVLYLRTVRWKSPGSYDQELFPSLLTDQQELAYCVVESARKSLDSRQVDELLE